jgi:hypothetical protein
MAGARLKRGGARPFALNVGPTASAKHPPACACPSVTSARSRDASVPAEPGSLCHPHTVTSNHRVHHDGRDAHTSCLIRINHIAHVAHTATSSTTSTTPTTAPTEESGAATTTMKFKSPRASLQLTHGLRDYIRQMRSRAPTRRIKNKISTKPSRLSLSATL